MNRKILSWHRAKFITQKLDQLSKGTSMVLKANSESIKASGILADIQKNQTILLETFDKFSEENNITYWIDFGTLIGAYRSGEFIPWDDDIDVTTPRIDYERIKNLSNKLPDGYYFSLGKDRNLIKLRHKELPEIIALDIFAADFLTNELKTSDCITISQKVFQKQEQLLDLPDKKRHQELAILAEDLNLKFTSKLNDAKFICYGLEFRHSSHPSIIIDTKYVFPLNSIEFENKKYPCPKNPLAHLTLLYRDFRTIDYSKLPHCSVDNFTMDELLSIINFIEKYAN